MVRSRLAPLRRCALGTPLRRLRSPAERAGDAVKGGALAPHLRVASRTALGVDCGVAARHRHRPRVACCIGVSVEAAEGGGGGGAALGVRGAAPVHRQAVEQGVLEQQLAGACRDGGADSMRAWACCCAAAAPQQAPNSGFPVPQPWRRSPAYLCRPTPAPGSTRWATRAGCCRRAAGQTGGCARCRRRCCCWHQA